MEYKQNKIRIGDNFAKIYTVIKYPKNVKVGWLSKIANIPNTISTQIFEPSDNTILIENMSKGMVIHFCAKIKRGCVKIVQE